jgi:DNA-binding NtrC family response regulator
MNGEVRFMNEIKVNASKNESQQPTAKPTRNDNGGGDLHLRSLRSLRVEAEINAISRTLEHTGWNRRRAAQLLSISYRGILYKIRQHNLTPRPRGQEEPVGQILKADSQG